MEMNPFETLLDKGYARDARSRHIRDAVIEVADTAYMCKTWFESYKLEATAADVIAMTRLIIEREAALVAAQKADEETDV
jgi:hypothetical protein